MDRLSSCYFCGAALDATLEEHPVVPEQFHPGTDTQKVVVLCGTCRRKLEAVLETVVDAVEANAGDLPADAEPDDSATEDGDLASTLGDDEEILTPLGEDDESDETASEVEFGDDRADDDDDEDDSKSKYTDSRGAGFRREDDGPVESGSLTGGAFSDDDDDEEDESGSLTGDAFSGKSSSDGRSATGSSSGTSSGGTASGSNATDSSGTSSDDGKSGGSGDSGSESGETRDISMTRLENTKVMRLLENREFPVDKAEFVTVAANAYQVSSEDCEKVIDLAVEHGLLREEDGQLFAGDA